MSALKGEAFRKLCFTGTQKSQTVNIKNKQKLKIKINKTKVVVSVSISREKKCVIYCLTWTGIHKIDS